MQVLSEDEIKRRQRNMKQKSQLLEELGIDESLSSALYMIDESIRGIIERHDDRCSYNACPLDFLTFGLDDKGRLIQFRNYIPGDPSGHCSLDRKTREIIYSKLPPILQALLPNKALADYEIAEDKKLAKMTPEEREAYLKAKEESLKKYIEIVRSLSKNKEVSSSST